MQRRGDRFERYRCGLVLAGILFASAALAENAAKKEGGPSAMRLPSGAIIVIAKDAEMFDRPEAILLTPEKYKELNDQIESLRKQVAAEKAVARVRANLKQSCRHAEARPSSV